MNPANFGWINQGGATFTSDGETGAILFNPDTDSTFKVVVKPVPTVPNYTVEACMIPNVGNTMVLPNQNYSAACLLWRSSVDGKMTMFCLTGDAGGIKLGIYKYNGVNNADYDSFYLNRHHVYGGGEIHLRLQQKVGLRSFWVSTDGSNWYKWVKVAANDFHTPDQYGFGVYALTSLHIDDCDEVV